MSTRSCRKSSGLRARIRVHQGKTQVWNRGGSRPTSGRIDQGPGSQTWKGDLDLPVDRQGLRVLGAPIGTQEHVMRQLKA